MHLNIIYFSLFDTFILIKPGYVVFLFMRLKQLKNVIEPCLVKINHISSKGSHKLVEVLRNWSLNPKELFELVMFNKFEENKRCLCSYQRPSRG